MPTEPKPSTFLTTLVSAAALAAMAFSGSKRPAAAHARAGASRERIAQDPDPGHAPGRASDRGQDRGPARRGAAAPSHGRGAETPAQIPARGWWDILKRTASQVSEDRLLTEAAGVTFFTLLAVFPAITAMVSLYGLFADRASIAGHLEALGSVIPGGGMQILEEQVQRITSKPDTTLGIGAILGLGTALWSANGGMKALCDALNIAYDETERRGLVRRTLTTLALTIGGILFMLLAMAAIVVVPVVLNLVGLGATAELLLQVLRWPLLLAAVVFFLAVIYRYGPSRETAKWRWVSWGSAVAALLWLAGSAAFSWYVSNFGNYDETYGSLGAAIGFMTWIWISSTIVLVGAELNAEMEHQTERDTTTGPTRPMGTRGAVKADTVAAEA